MQFTDTSEKGFQKYIVKELCTKGGYVESVSNDFDKEFVFDTLVESNRQTGINP